MLALAAIKDDGLMWYKKNMSRVKLVQWNSDAYDQDLVERTRDACQGEVDIVLGCLALGAPLQRSFKCLKKGGIAFVPEEINDKVLKSLQKLADQQERKLRQLIDPGTPQDLKALFQLVADERVSQTFWAKND